ncbi:MAG: 50S ribosomal protein L11 methyltransferase [Myxococcota bacterium]
MTDSPSQASQDERWATIAVRLLADDPSAEQIDRLDTLGLMVAGEAAVGGVERRDAGTLVGAPNPEQWVYTTPPAIEGVQATIATLARSLDLRIATAVEIHDDDQWREAWKQFYPPQILGDGVLLLRPSWVERRPGDPEREVVLDPGRAFGTGLHESTRLCLDSLCAMDLGSPPQSVLDLGCGSGILVLAAARLFPSARLSAIDFDPEAVDTTRENAQDNALLDRVALSVGTIDDVPAEPFELVIANIRPEVLIPAAPAMRERVAAGGNVLLSGILVEEAAEVQAAYRDAGFIVVDEAGPVMGEWQAVKLRAP